MEQSTTTRICDVIIVGLGPTGAVLANLLGQQGWEVVALEREEDLYYAPRAVHFDDEIMRVFQYAGMAKDIGRTSEAFTDMEILLKPRGKPISLSKIGSQDRRYGHPGAWWFHQPTLEKHFHDGLKRFASVQALYGYSVSRITQDEDHATVLAQHRSGHEVTIKGRYVIGCDGGRSLVRKEAGLELASADFDEAWVVVDTKTRSGKKDPTLPLNHSQTCDPRQPVTYVPMAGPYYEWQFMVMGNKSEREATDPMFVRQQLRAFVDLEKIEITRIAYYKFHGLWAKQWRNKRLILAGDSAHQMPPFLGQGMCSGVRDAHSLCWRMDLVLQGRADAALFDDYVRERSAHVQEIINGAMFLGNLIQTRHRGVAFLRDNLLFRLAGLFPAFNRAFAAKANRKKPLAGGFVGHNHAVAGHLAIQPKIILADGQEQLLDEALGHGFALLAREGCLSRANQAIAAIEQCVPVQRVEFAAKATATCVGDLSGSLQRWFAQQDVDFVLIRPDRYVFDGGHGAELASVAQQFARRFPSAARQPARLGVAA